MASHEHTPTQMVAEFHGRFGFAFNIELPPKGLGFETNVNILEQLSTIANTLIRWSKAIKDEAVRMQKLGDERLYRAHLMTEELGETIEALAKGDKVKLADGLGDLAYVTFGTGVTYAIPLDEVFEEIHRSNMTKTRNKFTDPRMRSKGANFSPPDIAGVIERVGCKVIEHAVQRARSRTIIDTTATEVTDVPS